MARVTSMESIEGKIRKAEEKARKLKSGYERSLKELKALHDRRREMQLAKLMEAIGRSGKPIDEVIRLIKL